MTEVRNLFRRRQVPVMLLAGTALLCMGARTVPATDLFQENFDGLIVSLRAAVDETWSPPSEGVWTPDPPTGWSVDSSNMPAGRGVTEWRGWSFATMTFWDGVAPGQNRANFTLAENVLAIADPDEWDDTSPAASSFGRFDSVLVSPPIVVGAGVTTYLHFDSHFRPYASETAQVKASFDGGPDQILLHYDSNPGSDNGGQDRENEHVVVTIPAPVSTSTLAIKWHLFDAGNDWYWAFDNIRLTDVAPPPPPPPPPPPVQFISAGPYVQFVEEGEVTVFWETNEPRNSILEFGASDPAENRVEDATAKTAHEITIAGIEHGSVYHYRIGATSGSTEISSDLYEFDSTFDYSPGRFPPGPSPYAEDVLTPLYEQAADEIVAAAGAQKGYCVVFGCGEGRLAYEIAKRTNLKIVGIDEDRAKVDAARRALDKAGIYGGRVSLAQGSLSKLPYGDYFANVIVSDNILATGNVAGSAAELFRVLHPYGGVAYLGRPAGVPNPVSRSELVNWLAAGGITGVGVTEGPNGLWVKVQRGPLAGGGEWSHAYADPTNSACSNDQLVRNPTKLAWFGRPGPRLIVDRHHRPMPSLVKDGRIFIPGNNRILAVDAYNGARLWDVSIPNSRRVALVKDSGHVAAASDSVYVAVEDRCCAIDVRTGRPSFSPRVPQNVPGQERHWGYIATIDDHLFGSGQKPGASRTDHSRDSIIDGAYWDSRPIVTSDYFFCLDRRTGKEIWNYRRGVVINPTIAISDDHVYFIESRNPAAASDSDGRVTLQVLLATGHGYLVKLDRRTGALVREQQIDLPFEHVIFLSYAQNTLLAVGTRNVSGHPQYELRGFDAASLTQKWSNNYQGPGGVNGDHGEQDQHPVIVGSTIYSRPYDFNLTTGVRGSMNLNRAGGGCGTLSASSYYLFGRGSNPQMYDLARGGANSQLTRNTRPGCWINILPAGGLVLIPESSSGCTCSYAVQASLAFMPQ